MPRRNVENPLTQLIARKMAELGFSQTELMDALAEQGVTVTKGAVSTWLAGGGVADRHRPALAAVLQTTLAKIQRAAAARDQQQRSVSVGNGKPARPAA